MNTAMYENPVVQDNIRKLQTYGYEVITPASGYLACGDTGAGKMPEPETLLEYILKEAAFQKDLAGQKAPSNGRTDTGGHRPGPLSHQPFIRKDGIRHCKNGHAQRSGGYAGKRTYCH